MSPSQRRQIMPSRQFPIRSGFGATTTAVEALAGRDLSGLTAIVTGGYSGLGLETTCVLAEAGATVVVPARDAAKARGRAGRDAARSSWSRSTSPTRPRSTPSPTASWPAAGRLPILVNSAGVMAAPLTRDGPRLRAAIHHQPSRPFPADGAAVAGAACGRRRPGDLGLLGRPPLRAGRFRRPELRAPGLRQVAGLRPVEDRQRLVRAGAGPALGRRTACAPSRCIRAES